MEVSIPTPETGDLFLYPSSLQIKWDIVVD